MNIKECKIEKLNQIVDFVYTKNILKNFRCRPFLIDETSENIKQFYKRYIESESSSILLQYDKDKLIGVCPIYWIKDDKYLSITAGIFAEENYSFISKNFLDYLKQKFNSYTLFVNIAKEHNEAISFYTENNFSKLEDAELYVLEDFSNLTFNKNVHEINIKNSDEIFNYLNKLMDENTYWNTKRLSKNLDKFFILAYFDNGIKGAIYAQIYKNNSVEIFGMLSENRKIQKILMQSLASQCKKINATKLILYSEDKNEILLAKEIGYKYLDSNICYMLKL